MGWASGSELLEAVARIVMPKIPAASRKQVAEDLISAFEDFDCDTICEVEQKDIRKVYESMYPLEEA